ncbi:MBL fold metallo-hydrolase [Mycobacterium hubeiense]|uniref:MBL fold metallo-hydrolase n=1 Tax=Mycobacterium hubeiense TaxID=1867256 RepID=UPI000C7EE691|nr:MBL fold metallo-hydrolase [Mycobacterium sp. QGD 101]
MRQIRQDLWETQSYSPFPGLTTHSYLWTPPSGQNVLFYSPGNDAEFDDLQKLGGVARQYLSHQDEAGPTLAAVAERFGARLYASAVEVPQVSKFATVHVPLEDRHVDDLGIEVIPTPGHTEGSICYLVPGADGMRYLFTGDTLYVGEDGRWNAGYLPQFSDAEALASTLKLLATLEPDLVASSADGGGGGAHLLEGTPWSDCVDEALARLKA